MERRLINLTIIDESSNRRRIPISLLTADQSSFHVIKVIHPQDYNKLIIIPIDHSMKLFVAYGNMHEGQRIPDQKDWWLDTEALIFEDIVSAHLIILGGGPGRAIKTVLKNIQYSK